MYNKNLKKKDRQALESLRKKLEHNDKHYAGYPPNIDFDYSELYDFLQFSINNLGDPFTGKNTRSSHAIEQELLSFFAKITHAPEDFSGYVTNGSTEGNLYSLYLARKQHPEAIAYFSTHSHYSIPKNLDILSIPHVLVDSLPNGEINYDKLAENLELNAKKPAIIVANIGTTVTSAIDNLTKIKQILADKKIAEYFIHADAAFDGMILPFINDPPSFRFDDDIDSIVISGHKLIGSPIPCGIVITKKIYVEKITKIIDYLYKPDTTISGSRNGITPLFLWYAIKRIGIEGFKQMVNDGLQKSKYAIDLFKQNNIPAWKNPYALTVVLPALSDNLLTKWNVPSGYGFSSITCLPKLTYEMIDELCQDIKADNKNALVINSSDKLIY